MKTNLLIILFLAIVIAVHPGMARAATITREQQIESLKAKIENLKKELSHLVLQEQVLARAYTVVDLSDNTVITQKNSDVVYPIASITKLMNAVVTLENVDMEKTITVTPQMLQADGASPALFSNLTISAKDVLKISLIQSTNDAAQVLSYFVGNQKFLELMNQKAKDLGMQNSHFSDVHGFGPTNRSNSKDLVKLLAYIYQNHPEILSITKENDFWLPDAKGVLLKFQNVNNMYDNPDFVGAKAGYTIEAKQTLAAVADINGKPVAIALLRSTNRKKDALQIVAWLKENSAKTLAE